MCYNDNVVTDKSEMANRLKNVFLEKETAPIRSDLPTANCDYVSLIESNSGRMTLFESTPDEVSDVINQLKNSFGLHDRPTNFQKIMKYCITTKLSEMYNICM